MFTWKMQNNMKIKLISLISFLVVFGIGIVIGTTLIDKETIYQKGYQEAWEKAEKLVEEKVPFFKTPQEIHSLNGEVIETSANFLKIKVGPLTQNPLSEVYKETLRKVKITSETLIVKRVERSLEERREMMEKELPPLFEFFKEEEIEISQIKKGDRVVVESEENILTKSEFKAKKIILINL